MLSHKAQYKADVLVNLFSFVPLPANQSPKKLSILEGKFKLKAI